VDRVLTPKTVNELKLGAMKYGDVTSYTTGGLPTAVSWECKVSPRNTAAIPPLPQMSFSGTGAPTNIKFGDTASFGERRSSMIQNIYTVTDTVSRTIGSHSLKAGLRVASRRLQRAAAEQCRRTGLVLRVGQFRQFQRVGVRDFLMGLPFLHSADSRKIEDPSQANRNGRFRQDTGGSRPAALNWACATSCPESL